MNIYIYIYTYIYIYIYTKLNEGKKMKTNVYNSEFHALQSSGIQFSLPKNKRQKY